MTPSEYEEYVSCLVSQLDCFRNAIIVRNQKFDGVRQPGQYEIDVALRVVLSETIDFFLIVECKNWSRPVDRPVIQKLAQTRDALAAHKAAVASPVGFTKEAVQVAEAHGVALWVISKSIWKVISYYSYPFFSNLDAYHARLKSLEDIGFTARKSAELSTELRVVDFFYAKPRESRLLRPRESQFSTWVKFIHICHKEYAQPGSNELGVDKRLAATLLADECAKILGIPLKLYG